MPGRDKEHDHVSLSDFLQEADAQQVDLFLRYLSPGDVRRVKFWRESVVAAGQPSHLATLLRGNCQGGPEQLKDVMADDEVAFKFEDSPSEAQRYSSELRLRMRPDLEAEFSAPWPGKSDVLKTMRISREPKKSCSTQ